MKKAINPKLTKSSRLLRSREMLRPRSISESCIAMENEYLKRMLKQMNVFNQTGRKTHLL
jgi:hypothetical protein